MERKEPRVGVVGMTLADPYWVGLVAGRFQLDGGMAMVEVLVGEEGLGRVDDDGKVCDLAGADWVGRVTEAGGGVKNA
jgi:hypothetical protein